VIRRRALLAVLVGAVACGGSLPPAAPFASAGAEVDAVLPLLDGGEVDLADLRGGPVVVNVWASWCPPCIKEQPDLNEAAAALGDDVQFIGLNIRDASQDDAAAYVRDLDVPYSSIYSADGSALLPFAGTLTPRSIPSTVVLDAEGRVAASVNGRIPTTQTLVSLVEAVLDE
jgi:thiol-disulfide isomerase/thioredoxin